MDVQRCQVLSSQTDRQRVIVHTKAQSYDFVTLDLRRLVEVVETPARHTPLWCNADRSRALPVMRATDGAMLLGRNGNMIPAEVSSSDAGPVAVALASSSSSSALSLCARSPSEIQPFLSSLARSGAFCVQKGMSVLDVPLHVDDLHRLARAGVIVLAEEEFFELRVAWNPGGVDWVLTLGLHRPLPLCRSSRAGDDLLEANKLQLILELRVQGGWMATQRCQSAPLARSGSLLRVCGAQYHTSRPSFPMIRCCRRCRASSTA